MLYILSVGILVGFSRIRLHWLRWSIAIVCAAAASLVDSFQWSVGDFMTYESFYTMMQSSGDLGAAIAQQGGLILIALVKSLLLLLAIGLKPVASENRLWNNAAWLALPILLVITSLLYFRGGEGSNGLPRAITGISFTILYGYEQLASGVDGRQPVTFKAAPTERPTDIVLIVDESIAGAYLDINNPNGVYSGLATSGKDRAIYNFGHAVSITNCSAGSNLVLRYGGTRDNYRQTLRSGPSIWSYAKAAGRETIYINGQRTAGEYTNGMTDEERQLVDHWVQFPGTSIVNRDHLIADRLADYLNDDKAQFIYINKIGGHFPVNDKFPESAAKYQPTLARGQFVDLADMAIGDNLDKLGGKWQLYRNSYRNTLVWNVGGFFDQLFARAQIGDATIIYTSDHGQNLQEENSGGVEDRATHCTPNPSISEGVVPLVVITGGNSPAAASGKIDWARAIGRGRNRQSGYRIFPTLLRLMGYADRDILPIYGPDLLATDSDPFTFNTHFNARLGSQPKWLHVPFNKIVSPPRSDYLPTRVAPTSGDSGK